MWEILKWVMIISYPLGIMISFVGIAIEEMTNKKVLSMIFMCSGVAMCILSWVLLGVLIALVQSGLFTLNLVGGIS